MNGGRLSPLVTTARPTPRWVRWCLGLLLLFTLAERAWQASYQLHGQRHFDERFSFRNVSSLLVSHTLRPANAYYPTLSWLPHALVLAASDAVYRTTGLEGARIRDEGRGDPYLPTAYLLVRLVSALGGVLGIWLLYRVGRRVFSPEVGLVAATLLAALPAHQLATTIFKPDGLVVAGTLLAALWALSAVDKPSARRYALAGLGVGLAVSAKYTGVFAALPVTAGALWLGVRDRRHWAWLLLAGAVSIACFLALNPFVGVVLEYIPRLLQIYESKGASVGTGRLGVLRAQLAWLVANHLWPVAILAAVGVGSWLLALRRRDEQGPARRVHLVMLLALLLGTSGLYALSTSLFKGQNYLPAAIVTSLAAAWALVTGWRRLRRDWPRLGRPRVVGATLAGGAVLLFGHSLSVAYRQVVPTTYDAAAARLARLPDLRLRSAYFERTDTGIRPAQGAHRMVSIRTESLLEVGTERLERSDAEIFFARRLGADPGALPYLRRLATGAAERVEPRWLRLRGPGLVVVLHPWQQRGKAIEPILETRGARVGILGLEEVPAGAVVSLRVVLERGPGIRSWMDLALGDTAISLVETRRTHRAIYATSLRFPWPGGDPVLVFPPGTEPTVQSLQILCWQRPDERP